VGILMCANADERRRVDIEVTARLETGSGTFSVTAVVVARAET